MVRRASFKETHTFEEREAEATRIRLRHPNRVPVIIEKAPGSNVPDIDKIKFLVPVDLTVGQFAYVVRRRIHLAPDQAMFLFVANTLPSPATSMAEVHAARADKDGFLYFQYTGESTFG